MYFLLRIFVFYACDEPLRFLEGGIRDPNEINIALRCLKRFTKGRLASPSLKETSFGILPVLQKIIVLLLLKLISKFQRAH